ncbi:MAG TPA: rRNA methyltransferase [Thiolapillus brandeum]|uniref:Ribosomal RNA small subunit methyltransferase J n=1 Tax=Thiolapillus brandeum TaxID=1076588 RepID=A0A7C5IZB8_9GAMM|nr:rRNA methyltransferase [Thiolapillus brandeum]
MNDTGWAVAVTEPGLEPAGAALAERACRPLVAPDDKSHSFLLTVTPERLELRQTAPGSPGPVHVDFTDGAMKQRLRTSGVRSPLARALGLKPGHRPGVVDATAGLGRDAFVLAALGCSVVLLERQLPVFLLLEDGLRRALEDPRTAEAAGRMRLVHADANHWLATCTEAPEAIYLDPMYPERKKSALSAKGMQVLQRLAGDDADAHPLLETAITRCRGRVAVKRPARAGHLGGRQPDFSVNAPKTRYDVYLGEAR